jgi:hypothetical protein
VKFKIQILLNKLAVELGKVQMLKENTETRSKG